MRPTIGLPSLGHLDEQFGERMAAVVQLERRLVGPETGQVGACTEGAIAGAGEHDHGDCGLGLAPRERRSEVSHHRRRTAGCAAQGG